jgi:hypothetical protein
VTQFLPTPTDKLTGLGRRFALDRRDEDFPIVKLASARIRRTWPSLGTLDQGSTPMCVGFSCWKLLQSSPVINKPANYSPVDVYHDAQNYDGTSVRGAFKALKNRGYLSEYRWAPDVEALVAHILEVGPIVMGTDWDYDMFTPDRHDYIWRGGGVAGGHAWLVVGADTTRQNPDGSMGAVRILNSWGPGWAEKGRAWMATHVLAELLEADGEGGVPTEVKLAA